MVVRTVCLIMVNQTSFSGKYAESFRSSRLEAIETELASTLQRCSGPGRPISIRVTSSHVHILRAVVYELASLIRGAVLVESDTVPYRGSSTSSTHLVCTLRQLSALCVRENCYWVC